MPQHHANYWINLLLISYSLSLKIVMRDKGLDEVEGVKVMRKNLTNLYNISKKGYDATIGKAFQKKDPSKQR